MSNYYVAPVAGSGDGTLERPFGLADLPQPGQLGTGAALAALHPGDTLYFRAGTYDINGHPDQGTYTIAVLAPPRSGTAGSPITFASYPGEVATFRVVGGANAPFGNKAGGGARSHLRWLRLNIDAPTRSGVYIDGGSNFEVLFCRIKGAFINTSDNHDGLRINYASDVLIKRCEILDVDGNSSNSAGIKLYGTQRVTIEDCLVRNCRVGIYPKDSDIDVRVRRCVVVGATDDSFHGTNNPGAASAIVEHCFLEGRRPTIGNEQRAAFYGNFIFGPSAKACQLGAIYAKGGPNVVVGNTVISPSLSIIPLSSSTVPYAPPGQPGAPFHQADRNSYYTHLAGTISLSYQFVGGNRTLAQVRADGLELRSSTGKLPAAVPCPFDPTRYGPEAHPGPGRDPLLPEATNSAVRYYLCDMVTDAVPGLGPVTRPAIARQAFHPFVRVRWERAEGLPWALAVARHDIALSTSAPANVSILPHAPLDAPLGSLALADRAALAQAISMRGITGIPLGDGDTFGAVLQALGAQHRPDFDISTF